MLEQTDILIVGAGSAGFGAAYRALKNGVCRVTLVEKNPGFGGISTFGGVNCWEPGVSGNGVHFDLAKRLMRENNGFVGVYCGPKVSKETPWARSRRSDQPYESTLVRAGRDILYRFHFEPAAMDHVMREMLLEADCGTQLQLLLDSTVTKLEVQDTKITAVTVQTPMGKRIFTAKLVIDCSADIVVARMAGCAHAVGEDAFSLYHEPSAPHNPQCVLNGITQVFRVTPVGSGFAEEIPEQYQDVDLSDWNHFLNDEGSLCSVLNDYPNGDINVNMLPTIPGEALLRMPFPALKHLCEARAYAYWKWIGEKRHFKGYRIQKMFPALGIRESYRLVGHYVLTENDLLNGVAKSLGASHTIAFADHPADTHGPKGGLRSYGKYGIPYECMLPKEIDNVLVACRGASFSHIAASSARLSRTMIALGEAAGEAACQCIDRNITPAEVDLAAVRHRLQIEG